MRINSIVGQYKIYSNNKLSKNIDSTSFNARKRQKLNNNIHYISMNKYQKNSLWAREMTKGVYFLSSLIANDKDFDLVYNKTISLAQEINNSILWGRIKECSMRFPLNKHGRGCEYYKIYDQKIKNSPNNEIRPVPTAEYRTANTCLIGKIKQEVNIININYGFCRYNKNSNIDLAEKEYKKLKSIKNPTLDQINNSVATIKWLISQESPYEQGNDSIGNLLVRAIYHAYGVYQSPVKKEKSLDFEAFYRDLDEYIKIFPSLFEVEPYIIK